VDGKKISGNAQAWHKNKMLHHGTILFDADLAFVSKVLNVKQDKIESKGIKSNRARITNIKPLLKENNDIVEIKSRLLKSLLNNSNIENATYSLTQNDLNRIFEIQRDKYKSWNWNYGESPRSKILKENRFLGGNLQIYLDLNDGVIRDIQIFGDFLDTGNIDLIKETLINLPYIEEICRIELNKIEVEKLIYNITLDNIMKCLF